MVRFARRKPASNFWCRSATQPKGCLRVLEGDASKKRPKASILLDVALCACIYYNIKKESASKSTQVS